MKSKRLGGYKFRRQYQVRRYIVDFYCAQVRLAIEVDGKVHDKTEVKEYDQIRESELSNHNIFILRVSNDDILNNIDNVLETILNVIKKLTNPS